MNKLNRAWPAAALLVTTLVSPAFAIETNIHSYVCQKLDDFTATVAVISVNEREMGKISKDAVLLYKIGTIKMRYKEPNRFRVDGNKDGTKITVALDEARQVVDLNGLKVRRNMGKSPGKRKALMDVGLVSDYYLTYVDAKFLREGTVDGVPCAVFDMTYKDRDEDTSHHIVYIDPKTKVVRKREAYSQQGKRQATYYYKDLKEVVPGIWFPTRLEAENIDHVIAGVTGYTDIRVNTGIPDSVFKL